jgi:diadenosine tetraphosphate (Ap4A) HIT family hydrolase
MTTTPRIPQSALVPSTEPVTPKVAKEKPAPPVGPADNFGRIESAELNARFKITKAKVPDLLGDWRQATLEAAIEDAARATFWPDVEQSLATAEQQKGEPLDRREAGQIIQAIEDQRLPGAIAQVAPAITKSAKTKEQAIDNALAEMRPFVAQKKDPFMPVALGDQTARARETVLWENARVMVLVDTFSEKPKALVVPKTPVSFPADASKAQLDELARVAAATSAAFAQLEGCPDAEIWINPPQYLSVKQLHVHVGPPLPAWDESLDEDALAKQQSTFWSAMTAVLGQRLQHHR